MVMSHNLRRLVAILQEHGWVIRLGSEQAAIPEVIQQRYDWLPEDVKEFIAGVDTATTADDKSWFVTCHDLAEETESAFCWNQWELDSLQMAENDEFWLQNIKNFWDNHFPVLLSVRDGYRYLAVRSDFKIVCGTEPEYEETEELATTFVELLENMLSPKIKRFI